MIKKIIGLVYIYIVLTSSCESARILGAFSFPSVSHQVVFRTFMEELARRGHDTFVISPITVENGSEIPKNLNLIDVRNYSQLPRNALVQTNSEEPSNPIDVVRHSSDPINQIAENQIKSNEVQKILNSETESFDIIFFESCIRTTLGISIPYEVPVIEISSLGGIFDVFDNMGAVNHPILNPTITRRRIFNLSILDAIYELYHYYYSEYLYKKLEQQDNERLKRLFGPQAPSLKQLRMKILMLFLNVHPLWDSNRAVPHNVLHLGNLHEKPSNSLPEDIKLYLDSSVNGVIYVSFGNNFDTSFFSNQTITIFMRAFSQLPFDFLIKWNTEELPGQSDNIKIFKWLPQSDLLRHQKVKLFITQGGLQSTDEAITAGVPLIGIPLLGDQWQNVERFVYYKIGIYLSVLSLTEEKLVNAIKSIVTDSSYRDNIIRLRNIMRDQPQSPMERAVLWTEYILKNGFSSPLNSPAANISWSDYYEIELVSYLIGITLFFVVILVYFIKVVKKCVVSKCVMAMNIFKE